MDRHAHAKKTPPCGGARPAPKPAPAAAPPRPGGSSANNYAAIRSSVFGPHHERLPTLSKLHILASDPSFDSVISWTDDGKSFVVNRSEYRRRIMSVYFDQNKFKSFQNLLSRYRFRTIRTMGGGTAHECIIYSHPSFVRGHLDVVALMKFTNNNNGGGGAATRGGGGEMIARRSVTTRPNDETLTIGGGHDGAAGCRLLVLGAVAERRLRGLVDDEMNDPAGIGPPVAAPTDNARPTFCPQGASLLRGVGAFRPVPVRVGIVGNVFPQASG
ncbi:hypothetical protein ACHAW5_000949 [Stephanodiscus triporus]|uniref:HSF-type DNA-binding domain-containing protein n=1 Tax=Stephanodiscus triporus TaxID=2934178 RepID=A0ABD3N6P2_9STRA